VEFLLLTTLELGVDKLDADGTIDAADAICWGLEWFERFDELFESLLILWQAE
jgi:hypothetical protein